MTGSNLKYTQFVFHELKHAKPPGWSLKFGQSSSLSQYVDPQPQPTSVRSSCRDRCQRPLTAHNCPGLGQGRRGHFFFQRGWCVGLGGAIVSEKLVTTQDKHKQGHPLGRLTPRACVGACQPGLWPGGLGMAAEHPGRHPKTTCLPQWKVCISPHRTHCG